MIVAEQVQDPVHRQQLELVLRAVAGLGGLFGGDLGAEHYVTKQPRVGGFLAGARLRWPQLVHREGQHVGRAWLAHPALVQLGHGALVDQQHGQFGERVNAHLVEREPGHRGEPGLVHVDAGLVGDIDAHLRLGALLSECRPFIASYFSYASTIFPTSRCLTTS